MGIFEALQQMDETYINVYIGALRYVAPVLVLLLLIRVMRPLLTFRRKPEVWAYLCFEDGTKLPVHHWENVIGSSKRSDIVLPGANISKFHAVLTRYDDGSWSIYRVESASEVRINGKRIAIRAIQPEDVITLGETEMTLQPVTPKQEKHLLKLRQNGSGISAGTVNLILLSIFQLLCCFAFLVTGAPKHGPNFIYGFCGMMMVQWLLFVFYTMIRRVSFEVETVAFFLCTLGMIAVCTVTPSEALKQLLAMILGLAVFLAVGWVLRDLDRAHKVRYLAAAAGILFLLATLLFGTQINGAKNWIFIGGFSLQPSELSKVCFVFVGASAMDQIMTRKNLILFIAYSVAVCLCLALMRDLGAALIFFCAFLVVAFLRSGNIGTIALACTSLGMAGVTVLNTTPYAQRRFATYRHIWETPFGAGYQQTRALMCMASGGLVGLGVGRGWMKNLPAAESDMVIATIAEEWGLVIVLMAVLAVAALGIFAIRSAAIGRSSFYTIGGCTAAAILLVQAILNGLGTVDIVPLTGVNFPFVSNGGSSMIACWGLLAFIKAADTRPNASFAVKLGAKGGQEDA